VFTETEDASSLAYTGAEFDMMSVAEQKEVVHRARLFARVEPSHKSKIVQHLQDAGEIVAMVCMMMMMLLLLLLLVLLCVCVCVCVCE
jgi:magnesium-transporting ATPase (P-type)